MNKTQKVMVVIFINGCLAILAQAVIFREIINQVYINELILCAMLAAWLVAGAFAAGYVFEKFVKGRSDGVLNLVYGLAPVAASMATILVIFFIRYYKHILHIPVEMLVPVWDAAILSAVAVAPVSGMLGLAFSAAGEILKRGKDGDKAKAVYFAEALGSVSAGFLYAFFLNNRFTDMGIIYAAGIISAVMACVFFGGRKGRIRFIAPAAAVCVLLAGYFASGFMGRMDSSSMKASYSSYKVISDISFPTVKLTLAQRDRAFYVFENGSLSYCIPDARYKEAAGWPYLSHADNSSALVVNGGLAGMVEELSKFRGIKSITSVETDPHTAAVMETIFRPGIKTTKDVSYYGGDIIHYLKNIKGGKKFSLAIINARQPNTIYGNRFYTKEFFTFLKSNLNKNGMACFQLPAGENYMTGNRTRAAAGIYRALSAVFKDTRIVPGDSIYILASDGVIGLDDKNILYKISAENINEPVFNRRFVQDKLDPERVRRIENTLKALPAASNAIFSPVSYMAYVRDDLELFSSNGNILKILIIVIVFAVMLRGILNVNVFKKRPAPYIAISIIGGTAMAAQLSLLFMFQSIYGYLYSSVSLLLGLFMAGLAAGSFAGYVSHRINTAIAAATLAAVNIAALVCMFAFKGLGQSGSFGFILVLVAATGFSAGAAFNAAAEKSDTGALYSFDMIGGACGAILFNLVVLPLLGPAGALALNAVLLVPVMLMRI